VSGRIGAGWRHDQMVHQFPRADEVVETRCLFCDGWRLQMVDRFTCRVHQGSLRRAPKDRALFRRTAEVHTFTVVRKRRFLTRGSGCGGNY
jgi:hypothetical protein